MNDNSGKEGHAHHAVNICKVGMAVKKKLPLDKKLLIRNKSNLTAEAQGAEKIPIISKCISL